MREAGEDYAVTPKPSLPAGIDAALKEVEQAHKDLRAAAERLNAAMADLAAIVTIDQVRQG